MRSLDWTRFVGSFGRNAKLQEELPQPNPVSRSFTYSIHGRQRLYRRSRTLQGSIPVKWLVG